MTATQDNRNIAIETPLGKDVLLLQHLRLTERLSHPFLLELNLLSENPKINGHSLPGQPVTVRIERPSGGQRYVSGIVRKFTRHASDSKHAMFHAEVVPWFATLKLASDSRIFQGMTVPEILKQVFAEAGFTDFRMELQRTYPVRGICTQYQESHFAFASRLMEQDGIVYHFEHSAAKHIMVLTDNSSFFRTVPGYEKVPLLRKSEEALKMERFESWDEISVLESDSVTLGDYDYTEPKSDLTVKGSSKPGGPKTYGEHYEFPGGYPTKEDGEFYARVRAQEFNCWRVRYHGEAHCSGLGAGNQFTLVGVPGWADDAHCLVTGIRLEIHAADFRVQDRAGLTDRVRCTVESIPASVTYRPQRVTHRPRIDGVQTATVTGPPESDPKIPYVSGMGSIKVHFHWDRYGKANELSSGWIRTSQLLAGKGFGAMFLPRIGSEVLVAFEHSDPDRPVVLGCLYNGLAMPTLPLPHFAQRSYIHDDGGNALCFSPEEGKESIVMYSPYRDTMRVVGAADEAAYKNVPTGPSFP